MFNYIKLIRLPNLIFLALVQIIMRYFIILPMLEINTKMPVFSNSNHFLLLVLATVFIAAGGYIINDYFDIKIDTINKENRVIIGKKIQKKTAMLYYQIITLIGIIIGLLLSWQLKNIELALIFLLIPGLLWFYSAAYKRQLILGNLVVAFCAGLAIMIVLLAELANFDMHNTHQLNRLTYLQLFAWTGGFTIFSFIITFIRELIKDIEDIYGDREMECRSIAIVWGIQTAKIIAIILILITISLLLFANFRLIPFTGTITLQYITIGLFLPFAWTIYLLINAKHPTDYHHISKLIKLIMLIGLLYAPIFYLLHTHANGINPLKFLT